MSVVLSDATGTFKVTKTEVRLAGRVMRLWTWAFEARGAECAGRKHAETL